jgi:hypothetical protein
MLQPPHLQTVMMTFTFRAFYPVLLWFRVIVNMRFLFPVLCSLVPLPVRPRLAPQACGSGRFLL